MPIYEYLCGGCGKELEVTQRITESPLEVCPSCGGALQRLISNTTFILKGTGWYATDYARKGSSGKGDHGPEEKSDPGPKEKSDPGPSTSSTASDKGD